MSGNHAIAESSLADSAPETSAIVGAGSIGSAWAIVMATAGLPVRLYDVDASRLDAAMVVIADRLAALQDHRLIVETPTDVLARVRACRSLDGTLDGATYVQECAPEVETLKRNLLRELDALAAPDAVLASSSSFLPASRFAADLPGRERVLVVHPGNPPYLLRVVEIAPAPFTAPSIVERSAALMARCGLVPIRLHKEVEGFVFNRLQGAVLREAYCLVRDGVVSASDIDLVVRDGLGLRWSVMGPFETVDVNTRGGIEAHASRMGPAYQRMGRERGQDDPWTSEAVAAVTSARRQELPLERWEDRVAWRDATLMGLLAWRRRQAGDRHSS